MAKLLSWIKQAASQWVDPKKEERIQALAAIIERELRQHRDKFDLESVLNSVGADRSDADEATEQIYQKLLQRAWADEDLSDTESKQLQWLIRALKLDPQRAAQMNANIGMRVFEAALAAAIDDGTIDARESAKLARIARGMNTSVRALINSYFASQGQHFLRGMFLAIVQDGRIADVEWDRLLGSATALGLNRADLLAVIAPQARLFAERVLAEAKADGRLSREEDRTLTWILQQFAFTEAFREYVVSQIEELRVFTNIAEGRLPSVNPPLNLGLQSGEVVHFHDDVECRITKQLKSGPRVDVHHGTGTITDSRFVLSSPMLSIILNHTKVVELSFLGIGIEVRASVKGGGIYSFGSYNRLAFLIYQTAVGRANQTIVERREGSAPSRHIPRDVRQRVWQRYGGRCADCQSDQYLEFDHIVPVARGGSNSDANIQLLCRRCNLKKSDHI